MSAGETCQITGAVYGAATTAWDPYAGSIERSTSGGPIAPSQVLERALHRAAKHSRYETDPETDDPQPTPMPTTTRRLVQVFIADPDPNVPLGEALLYKGEPSFTDATDQELYFEVPVVSLLATYNAKRTKWLDKEASKRSGKDVLLEPARVRDLKMVVVNIAQF